MDNIYTRLRVLLHGRRRPCDCTAPGRRPPHHSETGATRSARRALRLYRAGAAPPPHHSGTGATRSRCPCDCTAPGRRRRITRTGATRSARRRPATVPRRGGAAATLGLERPAPLGA